MINKKSIVSPPKWESEQAIIMNGISNNPILLLFCVIFLCLCVHISRSHAEPSRVHIAAYSFYIDHHVTIILFEHMNMYMYPPSSRFLNKFLFLLEKLLKKWIYFYDSWGNRGLRHEKLWELILMRGFWRIF